MHKVFIPIVVLILIITACTPAPTSTPAYNAANVLFADNFAKTDSGWDRTQNDTGVTDYSNVGYLIYIKKADIIKWANPTKTFQDDVRIEVDAGMSAGPNDNAFGLICRYQDTQNFYYFYISSDGYAGIGRKLAGNYSIISSSSAELQKVDGINLGMATNHLRVDCVGNTLTLFVNGTQVAIAIDSSFKGGTAGLIARSYNTGGVNILFTNFYVYKP
jgi:hypothetical protein